MLTTEVVAVGPVKPLKIKISLSLDADNVEKLRAIAQKDDRALSSCINLILRNYLNGMRTLNQMYATVSGGADDALTFLENNNPWAAKEALQAALSKAEELYLSDSNVP